MTSSTLSRSPTDQQRAVAFALAAAGTVPFFGGVFDLVVFDGAWIGVVAVYAAVIASFISGIHWGVSFFATGGMRVGLLVGSNVAALAAWGASLLAPRPGFLTFAVLFAILLAIDGHLHRTGLWPAWFWLLRRVISAIVILACLAIAALA